uniref:Secreted protein n=1 Tax=Anopheles atroparvus TaxID=41427 RepID=A0A182JBA5_ANOAO
MLSLGLLEVMLVLVLLVVALSPSPFAPFANRKAFPSWSKSLLSSTSNMFRSVEKMGVPSENAPNGGSGEIIELSSYSVALSGEFGSSFGLPFETFPLARLRLEDAPVDGLPVGVAAADGADELEDDDEEEEPQLSRDETDSGDPVDEEDEAGEGEPDPAATVLWFGYSRECSWRKRSASSMNGCRSAAVSCFQRWPRFLEMTALCMSGVTSQILRRSIWLHTMNGFIGRLMCPGLCFFVLPSPGSRYLASSILAWDDAAPVTDGGTACWRPAKHGARR